ncbi:hypothetical protein VKT23_016201 [Stygiomarasmius scandens]|uniref:DUF6589 domain-containing protein n=1 Tax=Marasmiellus scandens TaxID=2682957 RepID=A0ABR1IVG0_9AGAR
MEHLIGYLKAVFAAKGIYSTWEFLSDVSAAIVEIQGIKKHFNAMMDNSYKNQTHKDADTSDLVLQLADKIDELKIQHYNSNRRTLYSQAAPDLIKAGWDKISNASLRTFNDKIRSFRENTPMSDKELKDDIKEMTFSDISNVYYH